jgi:hypothetical protein
MDVIAPASVVRVLKMRKLLFLVVALLLALLAGCLPNTPFSPISIRHSANGNVAVDYEPCKPGQVTKLTVRAPANPTQDQPPVIWTLMFAAPQSKLHVELGVVPHDAVEGTRWAGLQPNSPKQVFDVLLEGPDGFFTDESFTLSDLTAGRIRFHDKEMSLSEYQKARKC